MRFDKTCNKLIKIFSESSTVKKHNERYAIFIHDTSERMTGKLQPCNYEYPDDRKMWHAYLCNDMVKKLPFEQALREYCTFLHKHNINSVDGDEDELSIKEMERYVTHDASHYNTINSTWYWYDGGDDGALGVEIDMHTGGLISIARNSTTDEEGSIMDL